MSKVPSLGRKIVLKSSDLTWNQVVMSTLSDVPKTVDDIVRLVRVGFPLHAQNNDHVRAKVRQTLRFLNDHDADGIKGRLIPFARISGYALSEAGQKRWTAYPTPIQN